MKQRLLFRSLALFLTLGCWGNAWAQSFELPQKPVKKVKLHPLEKQWMKRGMKLRIHISSLAIRYGDKHPIMVKHVKQYVVLVRELKRLRFLLKQKVKVQGFLTMLLNQSLRLAMKLAASRMRYSPKHPKMKALLLQQRLLKARLQGWLRVQKYKGPLYPPPPKPTKPTGRSTL